MADPYAPPHDSGREPAHPGPFWLVAAVGIGLVVLGRIVLFFTNVGDLDGELVTPALFEALGVAALAVGLALAAVLQRGLSTGVRVALLLGAGYFAVSSSPFGILSSLGSFF